MIRLLHLADVHLGASFSGFGDLAPDRREQLLGAFRRLPEIVAQEDIHAVLIAGDLFDRPDPSSETRAAAHETIRRIVEAGRPVFIVPGNHDAVTFWPHPYEEPPGGARVFMGPRFESETIQTPGGPLHVYGLAYDPALEPDPLSTFQRLDVSGVHVAVLHGSTADVPHWGTSPNALRLPEEAVQQLDVDYLALGDYHRFRPPDGFWDGRGVPACYSGSFAALDLMETGPRGYVVVEVEPGRSVRVLHRESDVRRVEDAGDVDVMDLESPQDVAEAVARRVSGSVIPVARLIGTPAYPLDVEEVEAYLMERFGHARVVDETRYFESARLDEFAERDDLIGHVVRVGRNRVQATADEVERRTLEHALRIVLNALGAR